MNLRLTEGFAKIEILKKKHHFHFTLNHFNLLKVLNAYLIKSICFTNRRLRLAIRSGSVIPSEIVKSIM